MEEFKPKRKNNNYSGTDKAGAPRRAPRQNHQNKPPQENSTPAAVLPARPLPKLPRPRHNPCLHRARAAPATHRRGRVRLRTSSAAAASPSRITMPPTTR